MLILEDVFGAALIAGCWQDDLEEIAYLQDFIILIWRMLTPAQKLEAMQDEQTREMFEAASTEVLRNYEDIFGPRPAEEVLP